MTGTRERKTWNDMIQRCRNPNSKDYKNYGGRGIKVCERWHEFEGFYEDMGDKPDGMSLDRIDNDGDYRPSNCRWATAKTQCRNRRGNRMLTYDGQTKCASAWAEVVGTTPSALHMRLVRGWSVERALTTPSRAYSQ